MDVKRKEWSVVNECRKLRYEHHTTEWMDADGCELRDETVMEGTGIVGGLGSVSVRYSLITGEFRTATFR